MRFIPDFQNDSVKRINLNIKSITNFNDDTQEIPYEWATPRYSEITG